VNSILQEIVNKFAQAHMLEQRNVTENSCELIFLDKNRHDVNMLLTSMFGTPLKPTGETPALYHQLLTRRFGGIRTHQKLFMKKYDGTAMIAMVRPWRYGKYFTIKLFIVSDADIAAANQHGNLTLMERLKLLIDRYI
jgi:hypothetical protein